MSICIVIEPLLLNDISRISERFSLIKSYVNRSPGVANDTISVFIVFSVFSNQTPKASFVSCYVKETMTFIVLLRSAPTWHREMLFNQIAAFATTRWLELRFGV